jgi:hypothetical protein
MYLVEGFRPFHSLLFSFFSLVFRIVFITTTYIAILTGLALHTATTRDPYLNQHSPTASSDKAGIAFKTRS